MGCGASRQIFTHDTFGSRTAAPLEEATSAAAPLRTSGSSSPDRHKHNHEGSHGLAKGHNTQMGGAAHNATHTNGLKSQRHPGPPRKPHGTRSPRTSEHSARRRMSEPGKLRPPDGRLPLRRPSQTDSEQSSASAKSTLSLPPIERKSGNESGHSSEACRRRSSLGDSEFKALAHRSIGDTAGKSGRMQQSTGREAGRRRSVDAGKSRLSESTASSQEAGGRRSVDAGKSRISKSSASSQEAGSRGCVDGRKSRLSDSAASSQEAGRRRSVDGRKSRLSESQTASWEASRRRSADACETHLSQSQAASRASPQMGGVHTTVKSASEPPPSEEEEFSFRGWHPSMRTPERITASPTRPASVGVSTIEINPRGPVNPKHQGILTNFPSHAGFPFSYSTPERFQS